jgi:hypothetical protein
LDSYKKQRVKAGLYFGILIAIFSIAEDLLRSNNYSFNQILKYIALALISGAIAGLVFGFLIGLFMKSKYVNAAVKIETETGENILFETLANHFKGIEAVGGKLYLTNKRLIFKSHKLNINNHQLSILLNDIIAINRYKTLGIINNGLSVVTKDNTGEKFVVNDIKEWLSHLTSESNLILQNSMQ